MREAYEEAGIRVRSNDLTFVQVVHRRCPDNLVYVDYFFTVSQWQGEPRIAEPDKCNGLDWFPVSQLPSNVIPYIEAVIRKWQGEPVSLNEYGWNDNKERKKGEHY